MTPDTHYRVQTSTGDYFRLRVPASVTSPFFAMEHGVPFTGWNTDDQKVVINGKHLVFFEEIEALKEAF